MGRDTLKDEDRLYRVIDENIFENKEGLITPTMVKNVFLELIKAFKLKEIPLNFSFSEASSLNRTFKLLADQLGEK